MTDTAVYDETKIYLKEKMAIRIRNKFYRLIIVSSLLVITVTNAQDINNQNIFQIRERANTALAEGNINEAKDYFGSLAMIAPGNNEILSRLWEINLELSLWKEAIQIGNTLDTIGHNLGTSFSYGMAAAYIQSGNKEQALIWLEKAIDEKYENRTGLFTDPLFAELKENPRFIELSGHVSPHLDRVAGWRADLAFFNQEAQRLHGSPEKPSTSNEFQSAVKNLYNCIPQLSDQELLMEFNKLMAILGDGHSVVYGPTEESQGTYINRTLPLKFYDFDDGLFIVDATENLQHLIGSRVISLGEVAPKQAFNRLLDYRGVDNPVTIRWLGAQFYLRDFGFLKAIGASLDGQTITLGIETPAGEVRNILLKGGNSTRFTFPRKLRPLTSNNAIAPLYLQRVDDNYWFEIMPKINGIYFQFNQVRDNGEEDTLDRFSNQLLNALLSTGSKNLIVDVRHNNGGNNGLLKQLLNNLVLFDNENDTNIYVITSKNTFSAAQNFINRVELLTDAIFVGEPSSSSPNFVGEETTVIFPWSKIFASISNIYWQDSSPTDTRQWIAPDIPVGLTSEQYFNNIDPVMEHIVSLITDNWLN